MVNMGLFHSEQKSSFDGPFILQTGKWVIWQSEKTQMKSCRIQHFIRVCTVCPAEYSISSGSALFANIKQTYESKMHNNLVILTCDPLVYTMDHSKFIVSTPLEGPISIKRTHPFPANHYFCHLLFFCLL